MFNRIRSLGGSLWILRRIVRVQEAQLVEMHRLATACEKIATALLVRSAQGFVTGSPDISDPGDASGQVRTTDGEMSELLYWEAALQRQLGRSPSDDEVVQAWESWKESTGGRA